MLDLQDMRTEYKKETLNENSVPPDPFSLFQTWFSQAVDAQVKDPNTMLLATSSENNIPNIRAVLLKLFDEKGFVFFTNYNSIKAKEIEQTPHVALEFLWLDLERQIIINGSAEKISATESAKYFMSRPKESQMAAWVSSQSHPVSSRQMLLQKFQEMKTKIGEGKVPLPSFWGGYRVKPIEMEFWQGRKNRLHDRFLYTKDTESDVWSHERLAP